MKVLHDVVTHERRRRCCSLRRHFFCMHKRKSVVGSSLVLGSARSHWATLDVDRVMDEANWGWQRRPIAGTCSFAGQWATWALHAGWLKNRPELGLAAGI